MLLRDKTVLLLDMNSTFMFGEDRFGVNEDFYTFYQSLSGNLHRSTVQSLIRDCYDDLSRKYPDVSYRYQFPSVRLSLKEHTRQPLSELELDLLVDTFAHHERGTISTLYANTLRLLAKTFTLGVVIDIWAPKPTWLEEFRRAGVHHLFAASSFSSDHGIVKPAPEPFLMVLKQLNQSVRQAVVIGDSVRRDLGGAKAAGIDCILVGGAQHPEAIAHYDSLLTLYASLAHE